MILKKIITKDKGKIPYYEQDGKFYKDDFERKEDIILISGCRESSIDIDASFYTVESNYYKHTVKILLYTYFKYGSFVINSIDFYVGGKRREIALVDASLFDVEAEWTISDQLINKLFEDIKESDNLANILIYLLMGQRNEMSRFDYHWRAFNAVYDFYYSEVGSEVDRILTTADFVRKNKDNFPETLSASKLFLDDGFSQTRAIRVLGGKIDYRNRKWSKELNLLRKQVFDRNYKDGRVLEILDKALEAIYKKDKEEFSDKDRKLVDKISTNRDKFSETVELVDKFTYAILFIYYFRCKYFHGEFWLPAFLIKNNASKELEVFSELLAILVAELLESLM